MSSQIPKNGGVILAIGVAVAEVWMSRLERSNRERSPSETLFLVLFRAAPPDKPTIGSFVEEFCNSHRGY
jgi:hypothetical protein